MAVRKPGTYERVGSRLRPSEIARIESIRQCFEVLDSNLGQLIPQGRYASIVRTKLEEAAMFATKAITHDIEREMD